MKKTTVIIIVLVTLLAALTSCAKTELDTPANMQLASVEAADYYLYVPDGWVISSQDGITAAYVSVIDNSNVSCARYTLTNEAVFENVTEEEKAEITYAKNYWTDYVSQLGSVLPGFNMLSGPTPVVLDGHAAIKCGFSATLSGKNYRYDMVICIKDRLYAYILTFTAEESNYEADSAYFDKITAEFRFQTGRFE